MVIIAFPDFVIVQWFQSSWSIWAACYDFRSHPEYHRLLLNAIDVELLFAFSPMWRTNGSRSSTHRVLQMSASGKQGEKFTSTRTVFHDLHYLANPKSLSLTPPSNVKRTLEALTSR